MTDEAALSQEIAAAYYHILVDGVPFQTATIDHDVAALDSVQLGLSQRTFSAIPDGTPEVAI
ncbi:hypothetical protein C463_17298 [Halorubrum californiense DSM 19288]|uniref:Uncharacterized protein n=1 Tax=Halorubrum californiense DSM 19288 TaxID=1227465 RepID=M0DWU6_9EURY|nr:hypothetical protein [Halorubrum californiense]ELZ39197.1 hypothetical protein C463_17298 [Halorubrum californiense DSM 19288]